MSGWTYIARVSVALAAVLALQACGGTQGRAGEPGSLANSSDYTREPAPFLWRVERDGAVSHVFGTVHVGVDISELPSVVGQRLDESHTLVVEADTESDAGAIAAMEGMRVPPGYSLREQLGEPYWSTLVDNLGDRFSSGVLDMVPVWVAHTFITLDDDTLRGGAGLDTQLVARARVRGLRMVYLETVAEQIAVLNDVLDIDDLRELLADIPGARRDMKVLLRAYRAGNLAALEGISLDPEETAQNPEENERLLFARNRAWMDILEPALAEGGVFVAVGVAHFVGEDGLLVLLRKAGFQVTRVTSQ